MSLPRPPDEGFLIDWGEMKNEKMHWIEMPIPKERLDHGGKIRPSDLRHLAGDVIDLIMNGVSIAYIRVRKVQHNGS